MNVAQSFMNRQAKRAEQTAWRMWRGELPAEYFQSVAVDIFKVLSDSGYRLACSQPVFAKRLEEYCWCQIQAVQKGVSVSFPEPYHFGSDDDFEWFIHFVQQETLDSVFERNSRFEVFDTSPAGVRMRQDFHEFLWAQVDLLSSKANGTVKWMRELYEDDDGPGDFQWNETIET